MDFKYFVKQATTFSGKLTNKICIYIKKSSFTVIGKNPSRLFWKENMHTKKAKMSKLWSASINILDTKIKYKQIIIISPCNRCYKKVMYKSYTSNSSSCFSQTSTCQHFRPSCTSFIFFIPPSPEQRPDQLPLLWKSCSLAAVTPALTIDGVSPYLLALICSKF